MQVETCVEQTLSDEGGISHSHCYSFIPPIPHVAGMFPDGMYNHVEANWVSGGRECWQQQRHILMEWQILLVKHIFFPAA